MKEDNWNECLENFSARKITPDKAKAKSLTETAFGRIELLTGVIINEKNANYIFEDYYSSILEILHSLAILDGFNISNHICIGFYLKEILKQGELYRKFDDLRYKRNSLIYYGKRMNIETAKKAIEDSKSALNELNKLVKVKLQK